MYNYVTFADELSDALNIQVSLLQNLENLLEPQTQKRNSTIKLVADLQNTTEHVLRFVFNFNISNSLIIQQP